jgi:hypothetical protein
MIWPWWIPEPDLVVAGLSILLAIALGVVLYLLRQQRLSRAFEAHCAHTLVVLNREREMHLALMSARGIEPPDKERKVIDLARQVQPPDEPVDVEQMRQMIRSRVMR